VRAADGECGALSLAGGVVYAVGVMAGSRFPELRDGPGSFAGLAADALVSRSGGVRGEHGYGWVLGTDRVLGAVGADPDGGDEFWNSVVTGEVVREAKRRYYQQAPRGHDPYDAKVLMQWTFYGCRCTRFV